MSQPDPASQPHATEPALDGKRKGRLVVGGLGVLLGLWFTWYTWATVDMGTREQPGAGVFPLVIGIAMIAVSTLTLLEAWLTDQVTGEVHFPKGKQRRTLLSMAAALIAFVALYQTLGQYIASTLFLIVSLQLLGSRSVIRNIGYGTAIGVAISAFFIELLGVRLPAGLLAPSGLIGSLFQ